MNVTFESIEQNGNAINWGGCDDGIFEDNDGSTILDTVSQIIFPRIILQKLHVVMQPKRLLRIASFSDQGKRYIDYDRD